MLLGKILQVSLSFRETASYWSFTDISPGKSWHSDKIKFNTVIYEFLWNGENWTYWTSVHVLSSIKFSIVILYNESTIQFSFRSLSNQQYGKSVKGSKEVKRVTASRITGWWDSTLLSTFVQKRYVRRQCWGIASLWGGEEVGHALLGAATVSPCQGGKILIYQILCHTRAFGQTWLKITLAHATFNITTIKAFLPVII